MAETKKEAKKQIRPENQVVVSSRRNQKFYVFLSKKILATHEIIELHALGSAMPICVASADQLIK